MRLLITTGIFPPDIGGPATFVPRAAAALHERGVQVTVLTLSDTIGAMDPSTVPVIRLPRRLFFPARLLRTVRRIVAAARSVDLIFANGLFDETALAAALTGTPWVAKVVGDRAWERARNRGWTDRELDAFQRRPPAKARPLRWVQSAVLQRARRVVVPSAYLGRIVAGWGILPERVTVIANAVDAPSLPPREAARRRLGLTAPAILSVGRLVPWKGLAGLIRAAAGLPAETVVIGDGPERGRLERLAAAQGSRIRFLGALPPEAVWEYLAAGDIFVLNSTYEGFPHVVLEAMAAGLAVVATAAGGTPELVTHGETGLLVAPGDDDALRAALERLVREDALRGRLADAGRAAARRFGWPNLIDRLLPLLEGEALTA